MNLLNTNIANFLTNITNDMVLLVKIFVMFVFKLFTLNISQNSNMNFKARNLSFLNTNIANLLTNIHK